MKQYRLLKDLPGHKKGVVFEGRSGLGKKDVYCDENETQFVDLMRCFNLDMILNYPNFFEEVQDRKFTKDDMVRFGAWLRTVSGEDDDRKMKYLFSEWIEKNL